MGMAARTTLHTNHRHTRPSATLKSNQRVLFVLDARAGSFTTDSAKPGAPRVSKPDVVRGVQPTSSGDQHTMPNVRPVGTVAGTAGAWHRGQARPAPWYPDDPQRV